MIRESTATMLLLLRRHRCRLGRWHLHRLRRLWGKHRGGLGVVGRRLVGNICGTWAWSRGSCTLDKVTTLRRRLHGLGRVRWNIMGLDRGMTSNKRRLLRVLIVRGLGRLRGHSRLQLLRGKCHRRRWY